MATDAIALGYALLFNTLTADTTFMAQVKAVYQFLAPVGAQEDYALLISQPSMDTLGGFATRIMSRAAFQVKIVGPVTHAANIHAAYARADALLQPNGQPLRNQGGTLACYRTGQFSLGEPKLVNGAEWFNHGGFYMIEA